jgi:uncharacterized protein (TIGR03083 family)
MTAHTDRLSGLIAVWHRAATDAVALLRQLDEADWSQPTDLPGWDVRAVAAHMAHLESALAGNPQQHIDVPPAPHVKGMMGRFTETGPLARVHATPTEIIDELESSAAQTFAALGADPPTDGAAPAPGFAAVIGWTWQTLLSNRPVDLWMHEQDIRRAVGRPGGMDSPAAAHVASVFAASLPFVLGKKVGAAPGTTVLVEVTGPHRHVLAAAVEQNGRGIRPSQPPADPTARLTMDFETWIVLAGGRRRPGDVRVGLSGDRDLGRRVLENLAVTP